MKYQTETIEAYLAGELRDSELLAFETSLKEDLELQEAVALHKEINLAILDKNAFALRASLNEIFEANKSDKKNTIIRSLFPKKHFYKVAAAVAGFMLIGGSSILLIDTKPSSERIYSSYYNPTAISTNVRSLSGIQDQNILEGYELFQKGKFQEATAYFNADPNSAVGQLLNGISFMELGDYKKANTYFNHLIEDNNNLFVDQAQWYLSLSYIKTGNIDKAKEHLKILTQEKGAFKDKAQKILTDLK